MIYKFDLYYKKFDLIKFNLIKFNLTIKKFILKFLIK